MFVCHCLKPIFSLIVFSLCFTFTTNLITVLSSLSSLSSFQPQHHRLHSLSLKHYPFTMKSFKVTQPGSKPTPKRTMSSSSERQAATASNTVVPRLRTASTISAMTVVPEGSNDGEESTQKTQKKPRKQPTKAKDQARNGGKSWTPAQVSFKPQ